jgi:hypothetical protein
MAMKERIIFQPYIPGRGAGVVPGQAVQCWNLDDAQRRAEKAMAGGRVVGAHIIRVLDDETSGDYGEPEYLTTLGRVPVAV